VPDVEAQCRDEGWEWVQFRNRIMVSEYPRSVYCERPKGHDREHATHARRSWLWYPGKWHCLRW
jgi:hypothetical protein